VSSLLLYSIPIFLLSQWLEQAWSLRAHRAIRGYDTRDTLARLGIGIVLISAVSTLGAVALWRPARTSPTIASPPVG
jgi:hypothetical protein